MMSVKKKSVVKILLVSTGMLLAFAVVIVLLGALFINSAIKNHENTNDLAILKQEAIVFYTPKGANEIEYAEKDRSKENNQIIKDGNYSTTITRTLQLDDTTTPENVVGSFKEKAKSEGWSVVADKVDSQETKNLAMFQKDCDTEEVIGKDCSIFIEKLDSADTVITIIYEIY